MKINNEFNFGDIVYLKTDIDQKPRIVMAMEIYLEGEILYKVGCGTLHSYHYALELSRDRDILLTQIN